uniref:Uncharacterized protein n=1 Tax=Rhizophagus irregularis (strain DAOM 181602 / DAOM 197198 / MUCL 43194) TaxID=747089 RepID=U9TCY4_RHIID
MSLNKWKANPDEQTKLNNWDLERNVVTGTELRRTDEAERTGILNEILTTWILNERNVMSETAWILNERNVQSWTNGRPGS